MEDQKVGEFRVQADGDDVVFVVRGNAWVEIEIRDGQMAVTAFSDCGDGRDGIPMGTIDEYGTIQLEGGAK